MKPKKLFLQLIIWRSKNIETKKFALILSVVIGLLSGFAAVILKNTTFYTHKFLLENLPETYGNYFYFALPFLGILITWLFVHYLVKDSLSHGITKVLYAVSKRSGFLKLHHTFTSLIASTFTVAFGGSVGLEAPIVLTGSAIGSNLSRFFRLNYRTTILLIGCGAAGAVAGIFKAPIAGVIFAIEVMMLDLTLTSLIPLLISAIIASVLNYFLMGDSVLFSFDLKEQFEIAQIPFYLLLGLVAGGVSIYFTRTSMAIERRFKKVVNPWKKMVFGGFVIGILIFLFPSLFGEGYDSLHAVLNGNSNYLANNSFFYFIRFEPWAFVLVLAVILIVKVIAMAVTNGSGGIGGVFAPSLFMGGISGFMVARMVNLSGISNVSEINFALVGMAGMMAGVMHAPLTAIFLIAEITGGYALLTPLIITSTISFLTSKKYENYSIYTKKLAQRGELITHHKDKALLSLMKIHSLIESNFSTVNPEQTLGDLVKVISKSNRNVFPVIDEQNNYCGVVVLDDIRHIIFRHELYENTYVKDLMFMPGFYVDYEDTMEIVAGKFNETGNYNLPVLKDGKYIGFVSRANVFSSYRDMMKDFSEE